ncbi:MAG: ATP-binding protein [Pseudomonadota bacterium]
MSSQADALWSEFAIETEDQLEALDRILAEHAGGPWQRGDIDALFRYFHSLKGTFVVMGFGNVEALAHRCEDVLSQVRDRRLELDAPVVRMLLRAVDLLKHMREQVLATRMDSDPAGDLLDQLAAACAAPAGLPAEPVVDAAAGAAAEAAIADDQEMLGIYSELLDQRLPDLAEALSSDPAVRMRAAETALDLANGAGMLGLEALETRLQDLAGQCAVVDGSARGALVTCLSDLHDQAALLEEINGMASGAAGLLSVLSPRLAADYPSAVDACVQAVDRLASDPDALPAALDTARAARAVANGLAWPNAVLCWLLVEERLPMLAAAEGAPPEDAPNALNAVLALLARLGAHAGADTDLDPAQVAVGDEPREASDPAPDGIDHPVAAEDAARWLRPELLATLSAQQLELAQQARDAGRHGYEILLDLEADPETAGRLLGWLSSKVETITSRTVHGGETNLFAFLVFCAEADAWVQAELAELDPEHACLRGVEPLDRGTTAGAQALAGHEPAEPVAAAAMVRVRSETIDDLMSEIGQMRTPLARMAEIVRQGRVASAIRDARRTNRRSIGQASDAIDYMELMQADLRELTTLQEALERRHRALWDSGLQLRVVPVDRLFGRLSRATRELAGKLGKEVEVKLSGREVCVDKSIVDLLLDPLMHLLRNALDHGIESPAQRRASGKPEAAQISISASERGNHVEVSIEDDGLGLQRERLVAKGIAMQLVDPLHAASMSDRDVHALIFHPGFSTARSVTEISGRGVGLDVVADTVRRLGGSVGVESTPGQRTRFTLVLPVSAALLRVLLVRIGNDAYALPERQLVTLLELSPDQVEQICERPVIVYQGISVPVSPLAGALGFRGGGEATVFRQVVVVGTGNRMLGLGIDEVMRFQDVFVKGLHPMLARLPCVAGASVLGDGRPVLILDVQGMVGAVHEQDDAGLPSKELPG